MVCYQLTKKALRGYPKFMIINNISEAMLRMSSLKNK